MPYHLSNSIDLSNCTTLSGTSTTSLISICNTVTNKGYAPYVQSDKGNIVLQPNTIIDLNSLAIS